MELRRFLRKLIPVWAGLLGTYGLLMIAYPQIGLELLYGGKYGDTRRIVQLWAGAQLVAAALTPCGLALAAVRRPDVQATVAVPLGAITLLSTAAWMRFGGTEWAVAGQILGGILWLIVLSRLLSRLLAVPVVLPTQK